MNDATFVLIDGPGHGASPGTDREFDVADTARAMLDVMDALGLDRAVIGGVSWGGMTAAETALLAPSRVQGLILMNTPMDIDGAHASIANRAIAFGARWLAGWNAYRDGVARSFFSSDTLRRNPAFADRFHNMLRNADRPRLAAAVRLVILRGTPLRPRLAALTVPTLVIAGIDDEMYPLETQADAALRIAGSYFAPVPGRHISPIEAPGEVASLVRAFLRDTASR